METAHLATARQSILMQGSSPTRSSLPTSIMTASLISRLGSVHRVKLKSFPAKAMASSETQKESRLATTGSSESEWVTLTETAESTLQWRNISRHGSPMATEILLSLHPY